MTRIGFGVIGVGAMGRVHAGNLATRVEGARLVAVADFQRDRAEGCARQWDVPGVYRDGLELLADPAVQAVAVCTPAESHGEIVQAAAAAGRHVFCEKPLESDLGQADRALTAVRAAGVKLQVGFNRRFDARFRAAREAVAAGRIGRPYVLHIVGRDPAPPATPYRDLFLDTTTHDFDMARWVIGSEIASLLVLSVPPDAGPEPDTALVVLRFAGGAVGTIDNSRRSAHGYDQRLELFGPQGMVRVENEPRSEAGEQRPRPFFAKRYAASYAAEMASFVRAIQEGREPEVTGEDGRIAVELALAARRSYEEGRTVELARAGR